MALDLADDGILNARIDALRVGWAGHRSEVVTRNRAYLRAYAPPFDQSLGEHDQWTDPVKQKDEGKFRSSYNIAKAVVDIWTALEMSEFPAIQWQEAYVPTPAPSMDDLENESRQQVFRASKLVARQVATMREQTLMRHVRRTRLHRHVFRAVRRKNIFARGWVKTVPDLQRRTFQLFSRIDDSTVYPVWSGYDDDRLDSILVSTRRTATSVNATWPGTLPLTPDGLTEFGVDGYYNPTNEAVTDRDRMFVWVEDYWTVDQEWESLPSDDGDDTTVVHGRVVNVIRANGKVVQVAEYPGWTRIPYVQFAYENDRDDLGFSDVGSVLPIQDSINRFMSQQQDVIAGESRPKFKYRGDADREIILNDGEVVSLDQDEDIEQIAVHLDVFPTQVHGQQILEILSRVTGLPDTVWGRITAAQNSGKALATAWRAVASRMVPRTHANSASLETLFDLWLGWMELYEWDSARDLYNGDRDYELDFPNQEPRDFQEVTMNALNRLTAGVIDTAQAMVETGEKSPDEMLDKVRTDYMDPILHPEKSQSWLLLQRLKNQIAIEAQQAGLQAQAQQLQLSQMAGQPPGGAPGPGSASGAGTVDQQAGAARQARTQAAQQAAPTNATNQNTPASGASTQVSTLSQDGGPAQNRVIDKFPI